MKEGWTTRKFSDIFVLQMGKTPSRDNSSYWGGTNTWVSIADMNCGKYIYDTKEHITNSAVSESGIYRVSKDTVIMSFKLSIGKTAIATKDLYTNEAIMSFNTKEGFEILPDYIYYYLKGYKWQGMNKAVMGMTLNKKAISNNIFSYPNTLQQQHIVEELDLLSSIIEKKKAQLNELDNLVQSLFYEMFGDPITNENGWQIRLLKEVIKVVGGYAFKSSAFVEEGIPVLRIGNINSGEFKAVNMVFWEKDEKLSRYRMIPGDLVMSLTGTVGKSDYGNVCILDDSYKEYYLNQRNAKLEIVGDIDKWYLSNILKNDSVKTKLTDISRGVRQANISNKDIENLRIPIPPLALQQQFASKIEAIEHQKELIRQSIKEVETLLNSRMDYYFN